MRERQGSDRTDSKSEKREQEETDNMREGKHGGENARRN